MCDKYIHEEVDVYNENNDNNVAQCERTFNCSGNNEDS